MYCILFSFSAIIMSSRCSGPSLKVHCRDDIPAEKTNSCQQVLSMHVMLPLTKGRLSNKDRKVSLPEGDYCIGL